jgi:hypothetical protein
MLYDGDPDYFSYLYGEGDSQMPKEKLVARILPRTADDFLARRRRIQLSKISDSNEQLREEFFATPRGVTSEFGVVINRRPIYFNHTRLPATYNTR